MTTNQAIAMAFPILTGGAVLLSLYAVKRWVQSQRAETEEVTVANTGGMNIRDKIAVRAIAENLSMADRIIRQAQRDLTEAK